MNFQTLLIKLENIGERFTSTSVSDIIKRPIKEVSNDFRRLHGMQFLRRERRKRSCLSKKGKNCYKGFEYVYSLSKQGRSYLKWMRDQMPIEKIALINLNKEIIEYLPERLVNQIFHLITARSTYKYRGPNRHFRLTDNDLFFIAYNLSENKKIIQDNFNLQKDKLGLVIDKQNLKSKVNTSNQINSLYMEMVKSSQQKIEQMKREEVKIVKFFLESVGKFVELLDLNQERNISYKMISIYLSVALFFAIPQEKFVKTMETIKGAIEKDWKKVIENRERLKTEFSLWRETLNKEM